MSCTDSASPPPRLAVVAVDDGGGGAGLARRLNLPLLQAAVEPQECSGYDALLLAAADGLSLQRTGSSAPGPVRVDFGSARMRHRRVAGHNELLGRAIGVTRKPGLAVLDATAGLGRDSFVLADLGCRLLMTEREPLVAALLQSGLQRAVESDDPWLQGVAGRMSLLHRDARRLSRQDLEGIDVVYLDPMFPGRGKSAAVKKEMALFQLLLPEREDGGDADELLHWALDQAVARVVVKRPLKAGNLGGRAPSHVIAGRAVRYDVHVKRGLT